MSEVLKQRDAERTKAELLEVATRVFAEDGYAGARVDDIAAQTRTTKRMIYYYFGSKEKLYLAVLEKAYLGIRETERTLDVDGLDPVDAVRKLAELTFDHHVEDEAFVRLVSIENIHRGEFMEKIESLRELGKPAVDLLTTILARGVEQGKFRDDVDAIDVHMVISSYSIFQVANQHTFGYLFDWDMRDPGKRDRLRRMIGDVVVAWLTCPDGGHAQRPGWITGMDASSRRV